MMGFRVGIVTTLMYSLQNSVAGYCSLQKPEYTARVKYIRQGFEKRVITLNN